ncbi:natural resistance-associated macrophage protein [Hesseltinella vesiculosa]|uniref:Natural resistance-associated macrophage protein n=1 Tax=Hesseltinella vesiculosa TaxID=101127 RepID=A0A1X2GN07_9FUNG|nr:natural resistance-associated macrophage protein [Hesseltinella vesiculosa]
MTLLHRTSTYLKRLAKYIGPGFMIAVGYLDPGNWSVDMEGGSRFGYTLLFVILLSNLIAIFLQNLAIRLGTISGLDLAATSRRYLPKHLNLFLYVLAELAIIATDLAEVIGSAIALNLLFPSLPLPAGVAITALDVLIILFFYNEDNNDDGNAKHDMRFVHYFEWFVMLLVGAVGVCFIIELAFSPVVMSEVAAGLLPSREIFTNPDCLYVAIGVIGATVMPHNLFLHSFIVQSRCHEWRSQRPQAVPSNDHEQTDHETSYQTSPASSDTLVEGDDGWDAKDSVAMMPLYTSPSTIAEYDQDDIKDNKDTAVLIEPNEQSMDELRAYLLQHIHRNLHYSFIDLIVALSFAFFINAAILVVASANFYDPSASAVSKMSDLFDAHDLLDRYIGSAAALVFAIALLCAGQSSTLTATLAGQVVMSGFLGMSTRPWLRRLITRLIAIIPAMLAACFAGRSGLSQLLVASQVVLSIQLPFAVLPLVYFTSSPTIMSMDLIRPASNQPHADRPGDPDDEVQTPFLHAQEDDPIISTAGHPAYDCLTQWPSPLSFPNSTFTKIVAWCISILLIGLNAYLVISTLLAVPSPPSPPSPVE